MAAKRKSMAEFLNAAEPGNLTVTDGLKRELPVEKLVPRKNQPRRTIDPAELESMVATVRALGIIQPIVVRPLDAPSSDYYEIVAGERRWRAAQQGGMSTVPVIIRSLDERRTALYSLAENVARSDLNPIELARGYQRVVKEQGLSQTGLAEAIGQNIKTVNRIMQLLKLPETIQELIEQSALTAKHGELLLGLPGAQQLEWAHRAAGQQWSVRELERQIAKSAEAAERKLPDNTTDGDTVQEQALWSERLGADVKLRYWKTGKVRIVITVTSLDEYQGVRERLGVN